MANDQVGNLQIGQNQLAGFAVNPPVVPGVARVGAAASTWSNAGTTIAFGSSFFGNTPGSQTDLTNVTAKPSTANVTATANSVGQSNLTHAGLTNIAIAALGPVPQARTQTGLGNVAIAGLGAVPQAKAQTGLSAVTVGALAPAANTSGTLATANVAIAGLGASVSAVVFAGSASVTVLGLNPGDSDVFIDGSANVTISANAPVTSLGGSAGVANVAVAALTPPVSTGTNGSGSAGVAGVTVAALGATPTALGLSGQANVTVAAFAPGQSNSISAGLSNVVVAGLNLSESDTFTAGSANVSIGSPASVGMIHGLPGVANVTVAALSPGDTDADVPTVANVSVAGLSPSVAVIAFAGLANVTGAGLGATTLSAFPIGFASVTVSSPAPASNVSPALASTSVTVAAFGAKDLEVDVPVLANVSVSAPALTTSVVAKPSVASVTVAANATGASTGFVAGSANVTIAGLAPALSLVANPSVPNVTAVSYQSYGSGGSIVAKAGVAQVTVAAQGATTLSPRFWVGGTGTWDASTTTHWSVTSGGAGGASVPSASDDVIIDANSGTGTLTTSGTKTVKSITYGPSAIAVLILSANITCAAGFTVSGAVAPNRLLVQAATVGTPHTITAAAVSVINADLQDIAGAGTGSWDLTGGLAGDCGGNSGITFVAGQTNYCQMTGASNFSNPAIWFLATNGAGGTGRVPLPQDTAILDNNTGSFAMTIDCPRIGGFDTSAVTSPSGASTTLGLAFTCYGSIAWSQTRTWGPAGFIITLAGRGNYTLTSSPVTPWNGIVINAPGGTYVPTNFFNNAPSRSIAVTAGTWDNTVNNVDISSLFSTAGALTRSVLAGNCTWTTNGNGTVWVAAGTGLTYDFSQLNLVIDTAGLVSNSKTFSGGNLNYHVLEIVSPRNDVLAINNSNSFDQLIAGPRTTVNFQAGQTQTITNAGGWQVNGVNNGYLYLPGVTRQYCSTPDAPVLDITGDIDIRVLVALDDWTPAAQSGLLSKAIASNYSYALLINTNGTIELAVSSNGVGSTGSASSTVSPGFANGTLSWVRATRVQSSGLFTFYTSSDGINWTQLGITQFSGAGQAMFNGAAPVEVGSFFGGSDTIAGEFYRAQIYNGVNGTLVFDADFTQKPFGANSFNENANGALVSIIGLTAQNGDGRVSITSSLGGTQGNISVASGTVTASFVTIQDNNATGGASFQANAGNSVFVSDVTGWVAASNAPVANVPVASPSSAASLGVPASFGNVVAAAYAALESDTLTSGLANVAVGSPGSIPQVVVKAGVANVSTTALGPTAKATAQVGTSAVVISALASQELEVDKPSTANVTTAANTPVVAIVAKAGVANVTTAALAPAQQLKAQVGSSNVAVGANNLTAVVTQTAFPGVAAVAVASPASKSAVVIVSGTANSTITAYGLGDVETDFPGVADVEIGALSPAILVVVSPNSANVAVATYPTNNIRFNPDTIAFVKTNVEHVTKVLVTATVI